MAEHLIDRSSVTFDLLAYPTKQGDMLLIRANIDADIKIGDSLNFDGSNDQIATLIVNCVSTMTPSIPVPESDPVQYTHIIKNTSITADDNIIVTSEDNRQKIAIKGETYDDWQKNVICEHFTMEAKAGLGEGLSPFIGWIALYSTSLDRYINYYSINIGNFGPMIWSVNNEPIHQGFIVDSIPSLMLQASSTTCGIGTCTIQLGSMLSVFTYETVHETESICTKIFAGRDPYDIDPEKPSEKDKPYQNSPDVSTHYGGGDGDFDYTSDPINKPEPPAVKYNSIGVAGVWTPSESQLRSIFKAVWTNDFRKKLIDIFGNNSLMDGIISVKQMPFNVKSSGTAVMALGTVSTEVSVNIAQDQFKTIVYTGKVKRFSGDFYDYAPFMKINIHLPFIGVVPLDVDAVMDRNITVEYDIDISTGDTLCTVMSAIDGEMKPLFTYQTVVGYDIPVTAIDRRNESRNMTSFAISTLSGLSGVEEIPLSQAVSGSVARGLSGGITTGADLQRSGSLGGSPATMDTYDVYLIYKCPNVSYVQKKHPGIKGNRATGYGKLSYYKDTGYVEAEFVNPHIDGCTSDEMNEIENLLKEGVYL